MSVLFKNLKFKEALLYSQHICPYKQATIFIILVLFSKGCPPFPDCLEKRCQGLISLYFLTDFLVKLHIFLADEVDHFAWLSHAPSPADSLEVLLGRLGVLKLNDMAHIHSVQPTRAQIVTDKDGYLAFLE